MQVQNAEPSRKTILHHLTTLTRRWGELDEAVMMEIRTFGEGKTPHCARFSPSPEGLDMAAEHGEQMNAVKGINCYPMPNPIKASAKIDATNGAKDEDIAAAFFCWVDCDDLDAARNVKKWAGPPYSFAVTTGTKPHVRVHIYWELEKPVTDMKAWNRLQIAMAQHFQSDRTVVNPSRVMRLAGTINYPSKKKQERGHVEEMVTIRTEYAEPRKPVSFEALQRVFRSEEVSMEKPAQASAVSTIHDGFTFDTGPQSLDREAAAIAAMSGEEWHNHIIRLVASYVSKGLTDAEIHALTDKMTLAGYTVEETRREVQTAINGARAKGWTPEEYAKPEAITSTPISAHSAEEIQTALEWWDDIEPTLDGQYIIKGVLDAAAMSVIYGPSNSGKTFFALDMAFHIAAGLDWRGRRINPGGVLYLAAEGGRGIVNRIVALRKETGLTEVPLALRRAGLDLLQNTADLQHIVDLAAEVNARAPLSTIVIDTLSRVIAGGDENSAQDMTAFIRNVDRIRELTGAHIIIVHHTGKDTARGARGHSSLRAATDTEIEVQEEDGSRAAMVTKQRDNEGGQVFGFSLRGVTLGVDQDGDEVVSCVLEAEDADEFIASKKLRRGIGGNQKIVADTFDQLLAEGLAKPNPGGVGLPKPGQFWAVEMDELRRVSQGKMSASNPRDAWRTAWAGLSEKRGLLFAASGLVWAVDRRVN
jgi:hypothetical protein